ncbi:hypothetical protein L9F63_006004 [Diploptera punctata]|uniref:Uncharacterized protein n=1 Tax=Diploptera punctata TaxID=6984 RepID=A0AAD7ZCF5_DIPPU|nr:hypothetical protein L9F63_006004 [Diploptera punctata]
MMADMKFSAFICVLVISFIIISGDPNVPDLCQTVKCASDTKCDLRFCLEDSQCSLCGQCIPDSETSTVLNNPCYYTKCSRGFECEVSVCNTTVSTVSECGLCWRCAPVPTLSVFEEITIENNTN